MNYRGSYRKLLGNSRAAMLAAVEVYNKPLFEYRDECAVILLMNSWELILKSILSKNRQSIYYPKKRNQDYRTLSWRDALFRAESFFPKELYLPISFNLDLLSSYRDNAIHFYNASGFGIVLHALAQTAILNYRDVLEKSFGLDLASAMNWQIMPIGVSPPIDVISYLTRHPNSKMTGVVRQFRTELIESLDRLEATGLDTGRLVTNFKVELESVKKARGRADATIFVGREDDQSAGNPLAIVRKQDPNKSHPLRQGEVVQRIGDDLHGEKFTSYVFQAIAWKHELKSNPTYCWRSSNGDLTLYSQDVLRFIKRLTASEVQIARANYRKHLQSKRKGSR